MTSIRSLPACYLDYESSRIVLVGQSAADDQQSDLERARVEQHERGERQRDRRYGAADLAGCGGDPVTPEHRGRVLGGLNLDGQLAYAFP